MNSEHTSFFAEHGWAITAALVFILGFLILAVGFFVKRLIKEMDKHRAVSEAREDKFEASINKLDRCVVKLQTQWSAQQEVCTLQHRDIAEFVKETRGRLGKIEIKTARIK